MIRVRRLVLDVLKPHTPGVLEFARLLAEQGEDYLVNISVVEMDEKTETVVATIESSDADLDRIVEAINSLGGSLHSIDEVTVEQTGDT